MNSVRDLMQLNLMQLDFDPPKRLIVRRRCCNIKRFGYLCLLLVVTLTSSAVHGQAQFRDQGPRGFHFTPAPRDFGDTPSPTEMMARLKFHKQQETPLFDLLREAGVDIFSKLSDDEKKLAGKFVEDMILKEGMDSDKVSSLMDHMNIGDAAKQALQDGIERAGGDSAISPEDRKELANKIRQQFLQQADNQDNLNSPANPNRRPLNQPGDFPEASATNTRQNSEAGRNAGGGLDEPADHRINSLGRLIDEIRKRNRTGEQGRQRESASADASKRIKSAKRRIDEIINENQANRQVPQGDVTAGDASSQNGESDQTANASTNPNSRQFAGNPTTSPSDAAASTGQPDLNKLLAREAFRQLESNLSEPQRKVVSEFKDKIQNGNLTQQKISELFADLQSPQAPSQFAQQLDKAGESLGLPDDSRDQVREAYSQLSGSEQRSLQQAMEQTFNGVDEETLSDLLAGSIAGIEQQETGRPTGTGSPTASSTGSNSNPSQDSTTEEIGREFLQDALATYNDPDSGYELSKAFERLKDKAEGVTSDRELANFGNISKKLFENSSKIFDSNSDSDAGENGIKPGQRFDQLLASVASKAISDNAEAGGKKDDSMFSSILNQALGVAIDQAVTAADDGLENQNQGPTDGWNLSSQRPSADSSDWQDQLDFSQDNSSPQPYNDAVSPPANNSVNNSPTENSIQDSAANFADTISQIKFNWWYLLYAVCLLAMLVGGIYVLSRLMQPASEEDIKHRRLEQKLKASSASPKDLVEAVDLFLLSRFGAASSWWNADHAATQISDAQPDWRDKVVSLFQVYRWSRYQADGKASVSLEQSESVNSTLRQLSQVPIESFDTAKSSVKSKAPSVDADAGEKS